MRKCSIALLMIVLTGFSQFAFAQNGSKTQSIGSLTALTQAEMLRRDMRKLWSDHVFWTRDYVIAAIGNQPDAKAAAARLMKNQDDIGNVVATYYGKPAGVRTAGLLKEHIQIAVELVEAAKAHDQARFQKWDQQWDRNAADIAEFLSKANPNWPRGAVLSFMNTHLSTTKQEVTARLNKNWDEDVRAFDAVYDHILKMADAIADGIIKQFPEKFSRKTD